MILPITTYGDPILRKKADEVKPGHPGLQQLIADMFETMYNASGVGLAAPQVGQGLRLFVVDASGGDEEAEIQDFKKVFINPVITAFSQQVNKIEEGCLSIPGIREKVERPAAIQVTWYDENFEKHEGQFDGMKARIVQHEYDHIEGVLFTDKVSPLKKTLLAKRLKNMGEGDVRASYPLKRLPMKKVK